MLTLDILLRVGGLGGFVVSWFRGPRSGASDCDTSGLDGVTDKGGRSECESVRWVGTS